MYPMAPVQFLLPREFEPATVVLGPEALGVPGARGIPGGMAITVCSKVT